MNKRTLAGAAALALTLGGVGAASAQAKAPSRSHAHGTRKASDVRDASDYYGDSTANGDGTGPPNILDWFLGPNASGGLELGIVSDLLDEL